MLRPIALAAAALLTLTACVKQTRPPGEAGVCYHVQPQRDGSLKYNKLPSAQPDLEHCAAALEAMRMKFLALGGNQTEIYGAYQGNFLFLQREGIFTAPSLEEHRYLALVRSGDGRLVIPGAMPQE
ncbi:hypothetical protein [Phenylobacterium conjunctum]|jgi:hypothetical protein|uniref:Lipoprotein n=1 Tax=Phenylobacterium conjunctum TaxID=1298959 RepID=A0ABW3T0K6_9CAUL